MEILLGFQIGDRVRLKDTITAAHISGRNETVKIVGVVPGIDGGVILNRKTGGRRYWNVADLTKVSN